MKKSATLVAVGVSFAGSVYAQSSVTLYGTVDTNTCYINNANRASNGVTQIESGAMSNSRRGPKDSEDLSGGTETSFVLESGSNSVTGRVNSADTLLSHQPFVGLSSKDLSTIILSRQYNFDFTAGGNFDPLGMGNYNGNSWMYYGLTGLRGSGMLRYEDKWNGLSVGLAYGPGGIPGAASQNSYVDGMVACELGPVYIGALIQQHKGITGSKRTVWGIGGNYTIATAKLFAGYIDSNDVTGYMNSSANCVGGSAFDLNIYDNVTSSAGLIPGTAKRHDHVGILGVTYDTIPALILTDAFYYDSVSNAALTTGDDGKRYADVLLAEHTLSKRTRVYDTVGYNKVKGVALPELSGDGNATGIGKSNQTSVGVGIRHTF